MLRKVLVAALLVTLFGSVVIANVAPTMEDQYVTTVQDTAVTFTLRAQDEDIDPLDPGGHPLRFVILNGPTHGVIIGDLSEVRYVGPHDALVEVTYMPAVDFVGTDYLTVTVIDPFKESASGTTTIQVNVERERMVGLLSGSWDTSFTFDVQTSRFTAFRTRLTEVYRVGQLAVQGIAEWSLDTAGMLFDSLQFQADFSLGGVVEVCSTLDFDPKASYPFEYWRTTTSFSLFDVSFNHTFYFADPQTDSYQAINTWGNVGEVHYSNTLAFDMVEGCGFCFGRETLTLSWTWCEAQVSSTLSITDEGFQNLTIGVSDYAIDGLMLSSLGLHLDLTLSFTPTTKTLDPTLSLKNPRVGCLQLLTKLDTSGGSSTSVNGFSLYGIKFKYQFGDGITLQTATSLDSTENSAVTGHSDYFELLLLSGTTASCCGPPGMWSVATYFDSSSPLLFDWGMTLFRVDIGLTDRFSASTEISVRSAAAVGPPVELTLGWTARW